TSSWPGSAACCSTSSASTCGSPACTRTRAWAELLPPDGASAASAGVADPARELGEKLRVVVWPGGADRRLAAGCVGGRIRGAVAGLHGSPGGMTAQRLLRAQPARAAGPAGQQRRQPAPARPAGQQPGQGAEGPERDDHCQPGSPAVPAEVIAGGSCRVDQARPDKTYRNEGKYRAWQQHGGSLAVSTAQ